MAMITLHGELPDGNLILESWEIDQTAYLHMRAHFGEPMATTVTNAGGRKISQRFAGDGVGDDLGD